ncbi:1-acyl-sn-glycerol-3-phosphate acyltransferase [Variovorax sp. KK3]|uniref:lysophospholipid acyltransferase family protein n=1 Tax=Variovorax sp. KK3 TaxID=1855728 RepID=UPI00097C0236|nr:lysophospholipid acyltransferase family protein [Variovorax sp. KK3]
MLQNLSASLKLLRALAHAYAGWWTIRSKFPKLTQDEREQRVQAWADKMLALMDIRLVVQGTPPERGPVLMVSNHVSWLDILTIHAARHVRFVSKSNVQRWPLIGALATGAGSLYIERERRRDALRVVHHMTEALSRGEVIAVFPEGTTGDGTTLLPFHANLLQAAISSGAPVQPTALRFADAASGETSMAPRYIGADNLWVSLWRVLKAPPIHAIVRFGEPQPAWGRDRRAWALSLHADVHALWRQTH